MKLRNKKTGEIVEFEDITRVYKFIGNQNTYSSLAELNEEWEDYEEPKTHWYIYGAEPLEVDDGNWDEEFINELKITGNYFETEEKAEKAVEKLKAWKRLKDEGFRFTGYSRYDWNGNEYPAIAFEYPDFNKMFDDERVVADLDLLFGGEE